MKTVVIYLLLVLVALVVLGVWFVAGSAPPWLNGGVSLAFLCSLTGGLGGVVYCLRGVYLNACVLKQWDDVWKPWYYIRPIVSMACGGISFVFLKAGLLVLESTQNQDSTNLGFLALSFVAGLNVDKFVAKIEDVAQATWGIEKSRASKVASGDRTGQESRTPRAGRSPTESSQ